MAKTKNSRKPAESINPIDIRYTLFSQYLTDKDSLDKEDKHTYMNITRSYMKAFNNDNPNSSAVQGSRLIRKPKIQTEFQRLCDENGLGSKVRLTTLSNIVTGNYKQKTVKRKYQYITDEDTGKRSKVLVETTEEEKTPTAREAAHAIDVVEKIDLAHKKAGMQELESLSKEAKHLLSSMKDVTPDEDDNTLLMIAESELRA